MKVKFQKLLVHYLLTIGNKRETKKRQKRETKRKKWSSLAVCSLTADAKVPSACLVSARWSFKRSDVDLKVSPMYVSLQSLVEEPSHRMW